MIGDGSAADRQRHRRHPRRPGRRGRARTSRCPRARRWSTRAANGSTPGVVAGFSRIGLVEVDAVERPTTRSARRRRSAPRSTSRRRSIPQATAIAVNRAGGVTRAVVVARRPAHIDLRRAGRGDRSRRRHAADHPRRARSSSSSWARMAREDAGGSRAARAYAAVLPPIALAARRSDYAPRIRLPYDGRQQATTSCYPLRRRRAGAGGARAAMRCSSMSSGRATSCRCWR